MLFCEEATESERQSREGGERVDTTGSNRDHHVDPFKIAFLGKQGQFQLVHRLISGHRWIAGPLGCKSFRQRQEGQSCARVLQAVLLRLGAWRLTC